MICLYREILLGVYKRLYYLEFNSAVPLELWGSIFYDFGRTLSILINSVVPLELDSSNKLLSEQFLKYQIVKPRGMVDFLRTDANPFLKQTI